MSEDAAQDVVAEDVATEDVVTEDVATEDVVTEDVATEDVVTEDAVPDRTWQDAITHVTQPSPETEAAVDEDADRIEARAARVGAVEEAILAVSAEHLGTGSVEVIEQALQVELTRRGLWPQPAQWVGAVAADMAGGEIYQMGTS